MRKLCAYFQRSYLATRSGGFPGKTPVEEVTMSCPAMAPTPLGGGAQPHPPPASGELGPGGPRAGPSMAGAPAGGELLSNVNHGEGRRFCKTLIVDRAGAPLRAAGGGAAGDPPGKSFEGPGRGAETTLCRHPSPPPGLARHPPDLGARQRALPPGHQRPPGPGGAGHRASPSLGIDPRASPLARVALRGGIPPSHFVRLAPSPASGDGFSWRGGMHGPCKGSPSPGSPCRGPFDGHHVPSRQP